MPYEYKGHTLPIFKDKNWHEYLDPFFRTIIDNDIKHDTEISIIESTTIQQFVIEQYDEVGSSIYTLRVSGNTWNIVKVSESNGEYITEYASVINNPQYPNKIDAYNNRYSLTYSSR